MISHPCISYTNKKYRSYMTSLKNIFNKIDYTEVQHSSGVEALSLKDAPALIESLLPSHKLSIDVYKERMSNAGQTLTSLGSYWKGRKPLVLNRACVLASLLPATNNPIRDLEIFEMLMGMDDISISKRLGLASITDIVAQVEIENIWKFFVIDPLDQKEQLPVNAPFNLDGYKYIDKKGKVRFPSLSWRRDISEFDKHLLASRLFETKSYREIASKAKRTEELREELSAHIWPYVNEHLNTNAFTFPDLVEQLGVMRFGHRPTVADAFSGSGQIPFAASQLGCDAIGSDLNPVACMLTWGAFNIVGSQSEEKESFDEEQDQILERVKQELYELRVDTDDDGWRGKMYLYCLEVLCPSSGWRVPLLPSRVISHGKKTCVFLVPNKEKKRYDFLVKDGCSDLEMKEAETKTTLKRSGRFSEPSVYHVVDGIEHSNPLSMVKGEEELNSAYNFKIGKNIRLWTKHDIAYKSTDVLSERLYCVQWTKVDENQKVVSEFRTVTTEDEAREELVRSYLENNFEEFDELGYLPAVRIEPGAAPRYEGKNLITGRGWTHWHHLFLPRDLLIFCLIRKHGGNAIKLAKIVEKTGRLCSWANGKGVDSNCHIFVNQALNTLYTYVSTGLSKQIFTYKEAGNKSRPLKVNTKVINSTAEEISYQADIFITDPPYGDAVKYEEIYDLFVALFRKNPPTEFSEWVWDSRRALAIKGEDHDFKLNMVKAYKRMAECMPNNGLQIVMFTHQDGNIWADMANIVWASGLRVTAAWYLVTETDSALREGSYVKGTILLVLRKRSASMSTSQMELAYEIEEEVASQVRRLTGLNDDLAKTKRAKDGNLFEDADLQMAGYAAALKVLTQYSNIDGKDMTQEALRQRIKGQKLLVDELIDFAVNTANKQLVPLGISESIWHDLNPSERFYIKMLDLESKGLTSLDNYQNFAKAFSVKDWSCMMASDKANKARVKNSLEFGKTEMGVGSELANTVTRAVLYALMELRASKDTEDVVKAMTHNVPNYYAERQTIIHLAQYIAKKRVSIDDEEASSARVLAGYIENQRA